MIFIKKILGKRRVFLINKNFQLKFIFYTIFMNILFLSVLFISYHIFFSEMMNQALQVGLEKEDPYYYFLEEQQSIMINIYIFLSSISFLVLFSIGVFYSHRISGPIYAINNYIRKIVNEENVADLKLRDTDNFKETADLVNLLVQKYKN